MDGEQNSKLKGFLVTDPWRKVVLENALDAVVGMDQDQCIIDWNQQAEKTFGWSKDEVIGRKLVEIVIPNEFRQAHDIGLDHFLKSGEGPILNRRIEVTALHRNKTIFPVELTVIPVLIEGSYLFYSFIRDITDRKEKEEKLKDSEEQFRALANSIPQLAWMADSKGKVYWYNQKWYDYTGTTYEEMQGGGWEKVHHPDHMERVVEKVSRFWETGGVWEDTFPLRSKTGEYRWFLSRASSILDKQGNIVRFFGTNTDVTDQLRASEHSKFLSEATRNLITDIDYESRLQRLANLLVPSFADWCVVDLVNEDGSYSPVAIVHNDPKKVDLVTKLREQYPQKPDATRGVANVIRTKMPELVSDIPVELLQAASQSEEHFKMLRDLNLKSYICVPLIHDDKVLGALTIISAESKRRFSEDDLVLMNQVADRAALAIANAMLYRDAKAAVKVRDDFLSIASHELKTPITSLRMQLQIAQKSISPETGIKSSPEKLSRNIDISMKQVDRITKMVEDLLDISRIEAGKLNFGFQLVELTQLVREATDRFCEDLKAANCDVDFEAKGSVWVECDPFRIEQVIINLLSNASKYGSGKPVHIEVKLSETVATITVQDQGIGISKEDQAKIFERFERAISHNNISGWGLGLYIIKRIVDAHKGRVTVVSELNKGSTFTVELPLSQNGNLDK